MVTKVKRGGSRFSRPTNTRAVSRNGNPRALAWFYLGFRVIRRRKKCGK